MDNRSGLVRDGEKTGDALRFISSDDHRKALASSVDIPEQLPSFALPLTAVGISNKTVWVHLPQGRLPFNAELQVNLPADVRGIHMSRMEEVISELLEIRFTSLNDYARELGRRMLARQQGCQGKVKLSGKLPFIRETPVSKHMSIDSVDIESRAVFEKGDAEILTSIMAGAGVCHITACPCTQAYNQEIYPPQECPLPTHSQRSYTQLSIEMDNARPGIDEIIACLEGALHVTQDLLKRPDEAEIVMKAHQYPQFAEDAVRETARAAGRRFAGRLPESTKIHIQSLSLESIHIHDVQCRLETTLGDISKLLQPGRS
ncbi:MAG: GTP cyclohydrolase I FolE2 [Proteobacteria bacterium]|nr:GTP cyclohydrolase I FolE2 [Pseudomonadota bacterium]MBU1711099.1 GTP cyclohydrolase I FolE2 [Pseudomonadota bacterium]